MILDPPVSKQKKHPIYLFIVFFIIIAQGTVLFARDPLKLDRGLSKKRVGKYISYHVDTTGRLDIGDVSSGTFAPRFIQSGKDTIGLGYTKYPVWIKLSAENSTQEILHWFLEYAYAIADYVDLYVPAAGGFRTYRTGDHRVFSARMIDYRTFIFPMKSPPGISTWYLRIRTSGSMTIPLTAWGMDYFNRVKDEELLLLGIYYGIMLALAIYHLFIFFSVREKSYLYLLLFLLSVSSFTLVHNGLAFQYLWPDSTWWANISHPFFTSLSVLWMIVFTRSFLNIPDIFPVVDKLMKLLTILYVIVVISVFAIPYYYATQISVVLGGICGGILILTGSAAAIRGSRAGRFYMLACICLLAGIMVLALMVYGFLPENLSTTWSVQTGSSIMAILFSLGIADKINTMRDEREKAVENLKESEVRYRTLVENALDGIMLLVKGKPIYANPSLVRMLGYTNEDFSTRVISDLIPDTELGRLVYNNYTGRISGRDVPAQYEAQLKNKNGEIIEVLISASRIPIGGETGVISIITDISPTRRAEKTILQQYQEIRSQYEELEAMNEAMTQTHNEILDINDRLLREKEQLTATLRSIGDAVITTDTVGNVVLMNSTAERLTGWTQEEMSGQNLRRAVDLADSSGAGLDTDMVVRTMLDGEDVSSQFPYSMRIRDGSQRLVEISGAPIRIRRDQTAGLVLAIRDVTGKNKLEQEILKMSKIESLGVLAGGIAHDFNNILTAIIGNLSIAKIQVREKEDCLDTIASIEQAALRAANLTRQLLTFSKGGEPVRRTGSIVDLLRESVNFILSGSNVKSEFRIQERLWPVDIDADQISQVLNNIIINAMQAMPGGGILVVGAENISDPPGVPLARGRYIRISISDHGTGIPAGIIDKIFDPYFTTKEYGSGLGLASSFSIIKKHNGYINAESVPGKGSTFNIYLAASEGSGEISERTEPVRISRGGRILIMDDEEYIRQVSRKILEYMGYQVESATNGSEVIEMYAAALSSGNRFDAVIMDLTVPGGMGGHEAMKRLLEIDPEVAAVVSSGYYDDPVMANYRDYGFKGVIMKPFEMTAMIRILDEVLKPDSGK